MIIVVISLGVLGLGYCIYFDQRRRQDPEYKKKVKARRLKAVEPKDNALSGVTKISDLKDVEAVRMFFQQEIQLGEELLRIGAEEVAVDHLSNAVAVCGEPLHLLVILHQTLPEHVFQLLLVKTAKKAIRMFFRPDVLSGEKQSKTRPAEEKNI